MFKRLKDLKGVVAETPDLVRSAQAMQANAAQAAQTVPPDGNAAGSAATVPSDGRSGPIAGVDLETYAAVARAVADRGLDPSAAPTVAAEYGIDGTSWDQAVNGWNSRMQSDPGLARQFNALWRGVS